MKKIITYDFLLRYFKWMYGGYGDEPLHIIPFTKMEAGYVQRHWYIVKIKEEKDNTIILTVYTASNDDVDYIKEIIITSLKNFGALNDRIHLITKWGILNYEEV